DGNAVVEVAVEGHGHDLVPGRVDVGVVGRRVGPGAGVGVDAEVLVAVVGHPHTVHGRVKVEPVLRAVGDGERRGPGNQRGRPGQRVDRVHADGVGGAVHDAQRVELAGARPEVDAADELAGLQTGDERDRLDRAGGGAVEPVQDVVVAAKREQSGRDFAD